MSYIEDPGAIAASLRQRAEDRARDIAHCEELAARLPLTPGIQHDLNEMRKECVHLSLAAAYYQNLADMPETPPVFDRHIIGPRPSVEQLAELPAEARPRWHHVIAARAISALRHWLRPAKPQRS